MPGDPRIRASDADRERTATLLREHHAQGRLSPEEFNDRLDQVFAAKTIGDLDALLADLPGIDLYRLPAAGIRPAPPGARRSAGSTIDRRGQGPGQRRAVRRVAGRWPRQRRRRVDPVVPARGGPLGATYPPPPSGPLLTGNSTCSGGV